MMINNDIQTAVELDTYRSTKMLRDSTKLLGGRGISAVFSIFYFIIITQLFTKIELSSVAILAMITGLSAMITSFGLTRTCLQRVPEILANKGKSEASGMMKTTFLIPSLLSIPIGIIIFLSPHLVSKLFFKSEEFANLIKIIAVGIIVYKPYEVLNHLLIVTQKFGKLSIVIVINDIIFRIVALTLYFKWDISGYLWGVIGGQLFSIIFMILYLKEFLLFKSPIYSFKRMFVYSLPYYGDGVVRYGTMQADQLIIGILLRPEILATYFVVRRFMDYLILCVDSLLGPIMPKISEIKSLGEETVQGTFLKTSRYLSFFLIPMSFLIASIAYPLLQIYGGGKYLKGVPILVLLSFAAVGYGVYSLYGIFVYILCKPIEQLKQETFSSFLNIAVGLLLVIPLNILGIALARVFSLSGATIFSRRLLYRLNQVKFDINAFKVATISSLGATSVIVGGQLLYYRIYLVPVYILLGLLAYMLLFCRHLNSEDISLIRDFLPLKLKRLSKIFYLFGATQKPTI